MLQAQKILVIRYRFIGDTILSVPFFRNLRAAFPNAQIDVLVGPNSGEVLDGCPYINNLITFDTTRFHKYDQGEGKPRSFWSYVKQLRKQHYDTVFVLKRSFSSALLAFLIGAKQRIGYRKNLPNIFLNHQVKWNSNIHEVESTLDVLRCTNIPVSDKHLEAWISSTEKAQVKEIVPELAKGKNYVLIHAAAAHPDKMYPNEAWAEVIKKLFNQHGLKTVFTGASSDMEFYRQLEQMSQTPCLNLAGQLNLRQSMALYQEMSLAICVDSGPSHLACAVGTPTLTIFGPTDPKRWGPWANNSQALFDETLSCRPCHYKKTCIDRPCLTALSPDRIVEKAMELYQAHALTKPISAL